MKKIALVIGGLALAYFAIPTFFRSEESYNESLAAYKIDDHLLSMSNILLIARAEVLYRTLNSTTGVDSKFVLDQFRGLTSYDISALVKDFGTRRVIFSDSVLYNLRQFLRKQLGAGDLIYLRGITTGSILAL